MARVVQDGTGEVPLTFVFPCLNEERSLETCVKQVDDSLSTLGIDYEIVVADNGSTDRSVAIAESLGCRVVPVSVRGYGAALATGIEAARGRFVIFADCDNTYLYQDAAELFRTAEKGDCDLAIASRMTGTIDEGAMPFLHRYLGTPVLTTLINWFFSGKLTDCNSGFRCVKKTSYLSWKIRSTGMEFASELLIKALKAKSKIVEIKSGLRQGPPGRVAHLNTWRDGMRHLLFILSERPRVFELPGMILTIVATALQIAAAIVGPIAVAGVFHIFGIHTQILLLLAALVGGHSYMFACNLFLESDDPPLPVTRRILNLHEGTLFFFLLLVNVMAAALVAYLMLVWGASRFANLNVVNFLMFFVHILAVTFTGAFGLLGVHVLRKAKRTRA